MIHVMPVQIEVAVCTTDRIAYDPIDYYTNVWATFNDNDDTPVLFLPYYPNGYRAGCYAGNRPIIAAKTMKERR